MKFVRFFLKYAGVMAIPAYISFTLVCHLQNLSINPVQNWLSDYGNPLLSPNTAIIYNAGCIVTAMLLAVFYIGMFRWQKRERTARKFNICFAVAQISGLIGSVFLILASVFPLGTHTKLHSAFSTVNMIAMSNFLAFSAVGFLMNRNIHKSVCILGFFTAGFNIVTMNAFNDFYISEWIFFLLFMVYVILATVYYERMRIGRTERSL